MSKFLSILTLFIFSFSIYGQDYSIKGQVMDEEKTPLLGATVVVLDAVDSTMVRLG